jgi:serine/threonine-protein kinase
MDELALDEALASYHRAIDAGQAISRPELLACFPDLAGPLAVALEDLEHVDRWTRPLQSLRLSAATAPEDAPTVAWAGGEDDGAPPSFGDYENLEEIGAGGMGVVYKAWQKSLKRYVALKMIGAGRLATVADVELFHHEAEVVGHLDHPHIVPIYAVGKEVGRHYFTMKLIEGGSLATRLKEYALPWCNGAVNDRKEKLVRLMAQLARAVYHAHQRGILHRDLKPANILLDAEGQPHITDFGLAQRFGGGGPVEESGTIAGSPNYMAPEQAAGRVHQLTIAVDVYALGAMLYELLTGRPPFEGETMLETLDQVRTQEPVAPRALCPLVDRDLETVCLACLEKDPAARYRSAQELAEELERWLKGDHIQRRKVGPFGRLVRWYRRHPVAAGAIAAAFVLLLLVTESALMVARTRAERLEEEVLRSDVYAAQGVASMVLWQFEHLSGPVIQAAEDDRLRGLLRAKEPDRAALRQYVRALQRRLADPAYENFYVLDASGTMQADSREADNVTGNPFPNRDYFRGALRNAGARGRAAIHISRVYESENDGLFKFAITAAVHASPEPDSRVVGVVAATVTTTSTLGSLRLNDERRSAVLVCRKDAAQPRGPLPETSPADEYLILLHPAYSRGEQALPVTSPCLRAVHDPRPGDEFALAEHRPEFDPRTAMDRHYVDPVGAHDARFARRWLAGFAPVGNTEFVVIVQQRYDEAVPSDSGVFLGGVALVGSIALLAALGWLLVRRSVRR